MPLLRRRFRRKLRVGRKKRFLRKRIGRKRVNNYATVVDTIPLTALAPPGGITNSFQTSALNVPGPVYETSPIALGNTTRAQGVAQAYMYYRIRYVEVRFTPQADTFQAGGSVGVPYLYVMKDKTGSIPAGLNTQQFKSLGVRPIRLDDKSVIMRFKPTVLTDVQFAPASGAQPSNMYKTSPWLNTNGNPGSLTYVPSTVVHNGLKFFAENAGTGLNFNATITYVVDFKLPSLGL